MIVGRLASNKIGYRRLFAVFALFGFIMLAPACKDETAEPQHKCPTAKNLTISVIKENCKNLDVQNSVLKGTIIESQDVKNYTYLNLKDSTGQIWAAIPTTQVETGKEIEISNIIVMQDFQSKTLNKTFDIILFAVPSGGSRVCSVPPGGMSPGMEMPPGNMPPGTEMSPGMMSEMPPGMMPGGMPHGSKPAEGMGTVQPKTISQEIKVSKATGEDAYAIEEIYAKKKELAQKPVRVRAKVVKFLPEIMGKNWIHIQDGTGSAENNNYDITVSTLETAAVGDEVIVNGTLGADKDFGFGCAFALIIEDATIKKVK
ncbi:MAG: nucleotide-binding protein [Pseudomonadota bacterium]